MSVHSLLERFVRLTCDMFIKYEVSKCDRADRPSATDCLTFAMGKTGIKKLDIGDSAYKKIRKRAAKKLKALPGKGTGTKKDCIKVHRMVAAMKKKTGVKPKKAGAKKKKEAKERKKTP